MRKVVVTGLGFITCIGNDQATVSENLRELRHGIELYPPFQKEGMPVKVAAPVKEFNTESKDPEDWNFPSQYKMRLETLRGMAPQGLYAYCALTQAIEDAGLSKEEVSNLKTGLHTASAGSPGTMYHHLKRMFKVGVMRCSPMGMVSSIAGTLNFNLVASFKIKGASSGFVSACASSGHAMGFAYDEIVLNRQDRMLVVGAEDGDIVSILPFAGMRALTPSEDPDKASRPFDKDRDGFVVTGGSVAVVLEEEGIARKRGARIYSEMLGWGQASDGHHVVIPHPEGAGIEAAMHNALNAVSVSTGAVDYVNAHAPSTWHGDLAEAVALKKVFGVNNNGPAISSTKALTGHGLSFGSILEASLCIIAINEGFTPGSAHIETTDPVTKGLNILLETRETTPKIVLSNSSGFGGSNVTLVFKKYPG